MNPHRRSAIFTIVVVAAIALVAGLFYVAHLPQATSSTLEVPSPSLEPTSTSSGLSSSDATATTSVSSTSTISVPGMSKYTDTDFDFSFWYPAGWSLVRAATTSIEMSNIVEEIRLFDQRTHEIAVLDTIISASGFMLSPAWCGGCSEIFYYDRAARDWLEGTYDCDIVPTTTAPLLEGTPYTVDGLPIFVGANSPFEYIVPLSEHKFIDIVSAAPEDIQTDSRVDSLPLIQTIQSPPKTIMTGSTAVTVESEREYYLPEQTLAP
jgi:hypothetical protein